MPRQSPIPDREILEAALVGMEAELGRVNAAMAEIRSQLGQRGPGRPAGSRGLPAGRRKMSPAARKRIAEATRRRWEAFRAAKAEATPAKPKRKMSKTGRAAIVAATKKRWAEFHKQKAATENQPFARKSAARKKAKGAPKSRIERVLAAIPLAGVPAPVMP